LMWLVRSELHAPLGEGEGHIGILVLQSLRLKARVQVMIGVLFSLLAIGGRERHDLYLEGS
jgi:hypothetical protein